MIVNGNVELHISLNVYDMETETIYTDSYGRVRIDNPDQFFSDWCDHWMRGVGELNGASVSYEDLEIDSEEEDE